MRVERLDDSSTHSQPPPAQVPRLTLGMTRGVSFPTGHHMEPFISEIRLFAFGDAPEGWMPCDGTVMPISQYQALFSLIGTTYGGDGVTTFALPDLRGRVPAGADEQHPAGRPFAFQSDKPSDASAQPALALNFCIAWKGTYPVKA